MPGPTPSLQGKSEQNEAAAAPTELTAGGEGRPVQMTPRAAVRDVGDGRRAHPGGPGGKVRETLWREGA